MTNNEAIESMAFEVCDMDSDSGLTWEEVEACEVIINNHGKIVVMKRFMNFHFHYTKLKT